MGTMDLKTEILSMLRMDVTVLFKSEFKSVLAGDLGTIKSELQMVKTEILNNIAVDARRPDTMKTMVLQMERGLSSCLDDAVSLQTKVQKLCLAYRKSILMWKGGRVS